MKAEMVKELANLPKYTAWVKTSDENNAVLKNKIKIYDIDKQFERWGDHEEWEFRYLIWHTQFVCTHRDLIEEEIGKRQARWRGGGESLTVKSELPDKPYKSRPPSTRTRT